LLADLIEDTSPAQAVAGYLASTLAAALLTRTCMAAKLLERQFPPPSLADDQARDLQQR